MIRPLLRGETVSSEGEAVTLETEPIFDQATNTLVIQLPGGFRPGTRYDVALDGLLGGLLRASGDGDFTWAFRTPVPELVGQSPIDVIDADSRRIEAEFSTAIDEDLVSTETVRVSREGEALTPADIRFDDASNTLSFEKFRHKISIIFNNPTTRHLFAHNTRTTRVDIKGTIRGKTG